MNHHPCIRESVVVAREDQSVSDVENKRLVAYVVDQPLEPTDNDVEDVSLLVTELRRYLN